LVYAFSVRRRAIRIGLQAVRKHRLTQLKEEEQAWQKMIEEQKNASSGMILLMLIRLESEIQNG